MFRVFFVKNYIYIYITHSDLHVLDKGPHNEQIPLTIVE